MLGRRRRITAMLVAAGLAVAGLGGWAAGVGADRNVSDAARLAAAAGWDGKDKHWGKGKRFAFAKLQNAAGDRVGSVGISQWGDKTLIVARAEGLPPGFHGFHVHAVGQCVPPFTSAGGHFADPGQNHPNHKGDLPSLLVQADGTATLAATTDRFSVADLRDADGSAIIVHANPDNFANIPTDRYDPDPDATTLSTGDAGGRIACGVVR